MVAGRGGMQPDGDVLVCSCCGARQPFHRPPLLVIAAPAGAGKSTIVQRLAGTIPGLVVLDADTFHHDLSAVVEQRHDYRGFWDALFRFAHAIAQNGLVVCLVGIALPEQIDVPSTALFSSVELAVLVLDDDAEVERRLIERPGGQDAAAGVGLFQHIDRRLVALAASGAAHRIDATASRDDVEAATRCWIVGVLENIS